MKSWKVGELARQTGLTVRTLHHYDEIGLLSPSHRTGAGHRLYGAEDLARLLQILSLRQLGFSLEEIRACVARPDFSLQRTLDMHVARLDAQIEMQRRLRDRLMTVALRLKSAEEVSVEDFLKTMEEITMFEKYYTPEQLQEIQERGKQVGEERIRQVEAEWPKLIAEVRAEMEKGTDPASETVQELARRWRALLAEFTGGNPGIQKGLNKMYSQEPEVRQKTGIDQKLTEYVGRAMAAGNKPQ